MVDGKDYFIDLLFYHLTLRAFAVIDLKVEEVRAGVRRQDEFLPFGGGRPAAACGRPIEHRNDPLQEPADWSKTPLIGWFPPVRIGVWVEVSVGRLGPPANLLAGKTFDSRACEGPCFEWQSLNLSEVIPEDESCGLRTTNQPIAAGLQGGGEIHRRDDAFGRSCWLRAW